MYMGRRRKGILIGGKGISKCAKSSLKVGHWELIAIYDHMVEGLEVT